MSQKTDVVFNVLQKKHFIKIEESKWSYKSLKFWN